MASVRRRRATIDEYLTTVNAQQRVALEKLRRTVRAITPESEECISYGIPAFRLNGRSLVFFGAWTNHCSFYPGSAATLKKFRTNLKNVQVSKGTIRSRQINRCRLRWGRNWLQRESQRTTIEKIQTGKHREQSQSSSRNKKGSVHPHIGWCAQTMEGQRPAFCRLGNLSHERVGH
jgi:uncharacterized protein YdhG (YjbR/CyaY superfamily)